MGNNQDKLSNSTAVRHADKDNGEAVVVAVPKVATKVPTYRTRLELDEQLSEKQRWELSEPLFEVEPGSVATAEEHFVNWFVKDEILTEDEESDLEEHFGLNYSTQSSPNPSQPFYKTSQESERGTSDLNILTSQEIETGRGKDDETESQQIFPQDEIIQQNYYGSGSVLDGSEAGGENLEMEAPAYLEVPTSLHSPPPSPSHIWQDLSEHVELGQQDTATVPGVYINENSNEISLDSQVVPSSQDGIDDAVIIMENIIEPDDAENEVQITEMSILTRNYPNISECLLRCFIDAGLPLSLLVEEEQTFDTANFVSENCKTLVEKGDGVILDFKGGATLSVQHEHRAGTEDISSLSMCTPSSLLGFKLSLPLANEDVLSVDEEIPRANKRSKQMKTQVPKQKVSKTGEIEVVPLD